MNSNVKILVVDDKPQNLHFLSNILLEQGYQVRRAICGELAIKAAQAIVPDLILLDIIMSDLNGYEVCATLKQHPATCEIPIIFISALDDVSTKVKAFEVGGVDYITTPFEVKEVLARIKNQLTIRYLQQRLQHQNSNLFQQIQKRKQIEKALRLSEEKFSRLFQFSPDLILLYRLNDGILLEVNDSVIKTLSYRREELIGKSWQELKLWEIPRSFQELGEQETALSQPQNLEVTFLTKLGELHQGLLSSAKVTIEETPCLLINISNITELKKAEQALQESERRFRAIFNNSFQLTGLLTPTGYLLEANQTALDFAGISHEEVTGLPFWETPWWQFNPETQAQLQDAIATARQGQFVRYEVEIIGANGKIATIDFSLKPVFDEQQNVVLLIPEGRDITQRKKSEAALQKALEDAEAASKAKGEFLSKMSHELRTPLNAILGFCQVLGKDHNLNANQKDYLGIINRSGEHLLGLINDVLSMSKIEAGKISLQEHPFDLPDFLNSLEELFQLKALAKGLKLDFQIHKPLPKTIIADQPKLRQVLINLLENAIKFTQQGQITLRVQAIVRPLIETHELQFAVQDTGCGIPSELLPHLFESFVQIARFNPAPEGTGLGLSISQSFVKLMGGEIKVESQVNQGSLFSFQIPIKVSSVTPLPPSISPRLLPSLASPDILYRILIVEDVLENRRLLQTLLKPLGLELKEAKNGQEAVEICASWQPHLIFMDWLMPIMDGYTATCKIKDLYRQEEGSNLFPAPIIIALTAAAFEEQQMTMLEAGCDDVLCKPYRPEILLEKVSQYLGLDLLEAERMTPALSPSAMPQISVEDLRHLPLPWLQKLQQAVLAVNDQTILELLEELPDRHFAMVEPLQYLVDNFRLDIILELLQALELEPENQK